jgi:hypothetical protein
LKQSLYIATPVLKKAMRNYIFTEKEKEIIRMFLEDGIRLEGFTVLKNRFSKATVLLAPDLHLVSKFYEAIKKEMSPNKVKLITETYKECPHTFGHDKC